MTLSKGQQAIALMAVLGLGGGFWFWKYPASQLSQELNSHRAQLADLESKIAVAKARAERLDVLQAEKAALEQEVRELEHRLPAVKEVPKLLRILTKDAQKHRITMSTLSPQAVVSQQYFNEVPFNVTLTTTYHALARFLAALGQGERLIGARNLVLNAASSKDDPTTTVNVTVTLVAYTFKG
ncbi:MAG: type 4a pilus biogenesis protein PilO [Elusimicrobia bacterium]|nr:type 4a pilus biogenesis protein PilO [Elusimicrobiota bacterium]